jgi:hypothetical protein
MTRRRIAIFLLKSWSRSAGVTASLWLEYVVMPEHVRLLSSETERGNPSVVMKVLK